MMIKERKESAKNNNTIFLDVDDVILNSSETTVNILNKEFGTNKTINEVKDWGYKSIYRGMNLTKLRSIYSSEEFWKTVNIRKEFIENICENENLINSYNWVFVTQGDEENLNKKINMFTDKSINENFYNFFKKVKFYGIREDEKKSLIDMQNGIQVDDNFKNLENTNAKLKILLKNDLETTYNNYDIKNNLVNRTDLYIVNTIKEIKDILEFNTYDIL